MFAFEGLLIPLADWEIQNQARKIWERAHMKPDGGLCTRVKSNGGPTYIRMIVRHFCLSHPRAIWDAGVNEGQYRVETPKGRFGCRGTRVLDVYGHEVHKADRRDSF